MALKNGIKGEDLYNIGIRQAQNVGVELLKTKLQIFKLIIQV